MWQQEPRLKRNLVSKKLKGKITHSSRLTTRSALHSSLSKWLLVMLHPSNNWYERPREFVNHRSRFERRTLCHPGRRITDPMMSRDRVARASAISDQYPLRWWGVNSENTCRWKTTRHAYELDLCNKYLSRQRLENRAEHRTFTCPTQPRICEKFKKSNIQLPEKVFKCVASEAEDIHDTK